MKEQLNTEVEIAGQFRHCEPRLCSSEAFTIFVTFLEPAVLFSSRNTRTSYIRRLLRSPAILSRHDPRDTKAIRLPFTRAEYKCPAREGHSRPVLQFAQAYLNSCRLVKLSIKMDQAAWAFRKVACSPVRTRVEVRPAAYRMARQEQAAAVSSPSSCPLILFLWLQH